MIALPEVDIGERAVSPVGVSVRIRVSNTDGDRIGDAHLTAATYAGRLLAQAATDASGHADLVLSESDAPCTVDVHAAGYASERYDLPRPLPASLNVALSTGMTIDGQVRLYDGSLPIAVTQVIAWPTPSLSVRAFELASATKTVVLIAEVSRDGTFRLHGAKSGSRYRLMAGGGGWCSTDMIQADVGSPQPVVLHLLPLFGCILEVESGEQMGSGLLLAGTRRFREPEGFDGLEILGFPSLECAIAGLHSADILAQASRVKSWSRSFVVYAARSRAVAIDQLGVEFDIPGYRREVFGVRLPMLANGWTTQRITLGRTAIGFGSVKVRWPENMRLDATDLQGLSYWNRGLRMVMRSKSEPAPAIAFTVPCDPHYTEVGGLPLGVYDARLQSPWGWTYPRGGWFEVEVSEAAAVVNVPGDSYGGLLLTADRFDSVRCRRYITLYIERPGSNRRARKTLEGPPYCAYGISPGRYHVTAEVVKSGSVATFDCGVVDVDPGAWTTIGVKW